MLSNLFFCAAGFFVLPDFLSEDECAQLRAEAADGTCEEAHVVRGGDVILDRTRRRTKRVELSAVTEASLVRRMQDVRPRIRAHFSQPLDSMQPLQLLAYGAGDFFAPHTDAKRVANVPEFFSQRQVSVVVFLGHDGAQDAGCQGGLLQFHGLIDEPRLRGRAYAFTPVAGTLLAFPSHVLHEVTPVLRGMRYSLVTWLY